MSDTPTVKADESGTLGDRQAEHSQFGTGETGGGKPADGIDGNLSAKEPVNEEADAPDVAVPPEEDPNMGV